MGIFFGSSKHAQLKLYRLAHTIIPKGTQMFLKGILELPPSPIIVEAPEQ
jgi:hypothetical protein